MNEVPTVAGLPGALPFCPTDRLAALFDAHHARVYRLARRLTSSADDALDLVQETFLRAAQPPRVSPRPATTARRVP